MEIRIDPADKTPPYEQIKTSIITLIAEGELSTGFRLPPIRQLAGDLGVAPNTAARAYRELEADGFVRSRGRRGTIVCESGPVVDVEPQRTLDEAVAAARRQGLDGSAILALVSRSLARG